MYTNSLTFLHPRVGVQFPSPWVWAGCHDQHLTQKREIVTSQWRKLADPILPKWSGLTKPVISHTDVTHPDMMQWEGDITSSLLLFFPLKFITLVKSQEDLRETQIEEHCSICQTISFKSVKVMKGKKSLRNCHRVEGTKETWQQSARRDPGWDMETEKDIGGKTGKIKLSQ